MVMEALVIAGAFAFGVDLRRLVVLTCSLLFPLPALILIGVTWWRSRPKPGMEPVIFCEGTAGELRSGSTLRMAIAAAAGSVGKGELEALAHSETPMADVAVAVGEEFGEVGPEIEAIVDRAAKLGGPVADLFDEIAILALAQIEVRQEVSSASAPARAAALVLLLAPVVAAVWVMTRGGVAPYVEIPAQRLALSVGLILTGLGVFVGARMFRMAK